MFITPFQNDLDDLPVGKINRGLFSTLLSHAVSYLGLSNSTWLNYALIVIIFQPLILGSDGGEDAVRGDFPWAAFLHLRSSASGDEARCGGSLINDR